MSQDAFLAVDEIHLGKAEILLDKIEPASISLSVWSPPYYLGKSYEKDLSYESWRSSSYGKASEIQPNSSRRGSPSQRADRGPAHEE